MKKLTNFLFLAISISVFAQSPWTQEKGKAYSQISYTSISNYETLFGNPDYAISGKISDNTFQIYTEYGLSKKTTLILNLPLKAISFKEDVICINTPCNSLNHQETSLGNIELGIKQSFYKKDWVVSGQLSVGLKTGSFYADSGIRTGYDTFTFTPLFLAGKSFEKAYLQTFIGGDIRTNKYSSNIKIGGEYGKKLGKKVWIIGFLGITKSLENGKIILPDSNNMTGLYVNDQEYGSYGLKSIYEINKRFGINLALASAFFGNNVAKQKAYTLSLYHKF